MADGIQITLSVKDDGTATLQKVSGQIEGMERQATQSAAKISSAWETVKANWLQLTAVAAGAALTLQKAWDLAETAASFEESVGRVNAQLRQYGATAQTVVQDVIALANGQLTMKDAVELTSRALAVGLNLDQLRTLVQLAEVASDVLGTTMPAAMQHLLQSIAAVNDRAFKQIGLYVDLDKAVAAYAERAGKATGEITQQEKQMLLLNEVMAKTPALLKQVGDGTVSMSDKMAAVKARIEDFWLRMGFVAQAGAFAVLAAWDALVTGVNKTLAFLLEPLALIEDGWRKLLSVMGVEAPPVIRGLADLVNSTGNKAMKDFHDSLGAVGEALAKALDPLEALSKQQAQLPKPVEDATRAIEQQTEALKEQAAAAGAAAATQAVKQSEGAVGVIGGGADATVRGTAVNTAGFIPQGDLPIASGLDPFFFGTESPRAALDAIDREMAVLQNRLKPENWMGTFGAFRFQTEGVKALTELMARRDQALSRLSTERGNQTNIFNFNGTVVGGDSAARQFVRENVVPELRALSFSG